MADQPKHTPGPWRVDEDEIRSVRDSEDGRICTMSHLRGPFGSLGRRAPSSVEANSYLITAAPDMLAALKEWAEQWHESMADLPPEPGSLHADMLAAIAKAEGRLHSPTHPTPPAA